MLFGHLFCLFFSFDNNMAVSKAREYKLLSGEGFMSEENRIVRNVPSRTRCQEMCTEERDRRCFSVNYETSGRECYICVCKEGVTGRNCEVPIVPAGADCSEVKAWNPSMKSGVYKRIINGVEKDVHCDMETQGGGWTVSHRRMNGAVNFSRDWEAYKDGFGNISGEHWLGNEALHQLTSSGDYDLLIEMREFNRSCSLYALYSNFVVESEANKYRLSNLNFMEGTLGIHATRA